MIALSLIFNLENYNFELPVLIDASNRREKFTKSTLFQDEKLRYIPHYSANKGLKGILVNWA